MTINQLCYVVEIMKCKSFNKASERLYISQPALSISIRKLEMELGEALFIRSSAGIVPTAFCMELFPYIQKIVNLFEQMPLQVYGKDNKHRIRISVANGGFRYFSEIAGTLYIRHKTENIHIEFHDVSQEDSLLMVSQGLAQIGGYSIWSFQKESILKRLNSADICFVPIGTCPITVTLGPKNPLWYRTKNWVTIDMIQQYPIIYSFNESSNSLQKKLKLFNKSNIITCKERAGRGELLEQTDGISLSAFPERIYNKYQGYPNRRSFQLRGYDFKNEFGYIYNRKYLLTTIVYEFIDILNQLI